MRPTSFPEGPRRGGGVWRSTVVTAAEEGAAGGIRGDQGPGGTEEAENYPRRGSVGSPSPRSPATGSPPGRPFDDSVGRRRAQETGRVSSGIGVTHIPEEYLGTFVEGPLPDTLGRMSTPLAPSLSGVLSRSWGSIVRDRGPGRCRSDREDGGVKGRRPGDGPQNHPFSDRSRRTGPSQVRTRTEEFWQPFLGPPDPHFPDEPPEFGVRYQADPLTRGSVPGGPRREGGGVTDGEGPSGVDTSRRAGRVGGAESVPDPAKVSTGPSSWTCLVSRFRAVPYRGRGTWKGVTSHRGHRKGSGPKT